MTPTLLRVSWSSDETAVGTEADRPTPMNTASAATTLAAHPRAYGRKYQAGSSAAGVVDGVVATIRQLTSTRAQTPTTPVSSRMTEMSS